MSLKSTLIISILFFSCQWLYSQEPSKKETENWLLKKMQIFEIHNEYNKFRFDESGRLHIEFMFSEPSLNLYGIYNYVIIPLKTIDAIEISEHYDQKRNRTAIFINFYSSEENIEHYGGDSANPKLTYKDDEGGIAFRIEVKNDDMINRIKKAFIHLIELNGGKLDKDVF